MPPRKRPASSGRSRASDKTDRPADSGGRSGGGGRRGGRPPRLGRNPDADPVRIHREYVQERLGGGELPTPEAYERAVDRSEEHTSELQSPCNLVCRLLLEKKHKIHFPSVPVALYRITYPD